MRRPCFSRGRGRCGRVVHVDGRVRGKWVGERMAGCVGRSHGELEGEGTELSAAPMSHELPVCAGGERRLGRGSVVTSGSSLQLAVMLLLQLKMRAYKLSKRVQVTVTLECNRPRSTVDRRSARRGTRVYYAGRQVPAHQRCASGKHSRALVRVEHARPANEL